MTSTERGEVPLVLNDVKGVLFATWEQWDKFCAAVPHDTLAQLYQRLHGGHNDTVLAGIQIFMIEGDPEEMWKARTDIADNYKFSEAIVEAISILTAEEKKPEGDQTQSPSNG